MTGILVIDKPEGFTSFDVIAKLRGILGERRLGHGGTLDPMATGVLPVFCGSATRAIDLLPDRTKRYTATVRFGVQTDTGDVTGSATATTQHLPTQAELLQAIPKFIGNIEQTPPMYSAVKVNGQRLYDLARQGKTVERAPRNIEIFDLSVVSFRDDTAVLDVRCSKGTYIRTLCEDVAKATGSLSTLTALRRTASAGLTIEQTVSIAEVQQLAQSGGLQEIVRPVETAFLSLPALELSEDLARLFINGVRFEAQRCARRAPENEQLRVREGGRFLGLGRITDGTLVKERQFWFREEA